MVRPGSSAQPARQQRPTSPVPAPNQPGTSA